MARMDRYWDGRWVSSLVLKQRDYLVGRDPDCDLVLEDAFASRRHFQVCWNPEGYFVLKDLDTPNGTTVNGVKEFQMRLMANATIQVGRELLLFLHGAVSEEPPEEKGVPQWALNDLDVNNLDLDSTAHLPPAALSRLQARVRLRQRPHLLLRAADQTHVFALDTTVTPIGFGPVRASLGPSDDGKERVLAEIIRNGSGEFKIKAKGLFAKVDVNGTAARERPLSSGDQIRLGGVVLEFHTGLQKAAE